MSSTIFSATARILVSLSLFSWAGCAAIDNVDPASEGDSDNEGAVGVAQQALSTVTFRSSSTATGTSVTALSITKPAGVTLGDVLLARIANRDNINAVITAPAGWTLIRSDQSASAIKSWVYWKLATSSEPASYSFGVDVSSRLAASIVAFSGADPVNPIDTASGQKNGNSASLASPAITTAAANGVAVWFGTQVWAGTACPSSPIVQPAGFTEVFDTCLVSSSTGLLFDAAYESLGAAGLQTAFNGSSPFANTNTAQVVALRPAGAPTCSSGDTFASTYTTVGSFTSTDIVEVSGLAASRVNPGILYAHSENNANFVAINKATAAIVGNYVAGVFPWDWEDIATGPCPLGKCIFMGDIGRSSGHPPPAPSIFAVYRMKEPNIALGETSGTITGERFPFQYPDTPQNAETLMVHPTTGDIYVVTKVGTTGLSKVYKYPNPLPAPDTLSTLIHVADVQVPLGVDENFRSVTAGTIHPCANRFLLRTYRAVYEFRAPLGGAFETAFAASPVTLTDTVEGQGEAIEYEADGSGYFTMSERTASPYTLKRVARQ